MGGKKLTSRISSVNDGVSALDVFDDPADQPLGAFRGRVDSDKFDGSDGRHSEYQCGIDLIGTVIESRVTQKQRREHQIHLHYR